MFGLNDVGVILVMLLLSLFRVKLIVSFVVILVIGKLVVFEVSVEEWDMCGFILIMIIWLLVGFMVYWMFELFVLILILCRIVIEVFCII